MSNLIKVVALADLHCGHRAGICPPSYQYSAKSTDPHIRSFAKVQKELWNEYCKLMDLLKPVDVVLCLGDCIEGTGFHSGGTELTSTDRYTQTQMAISALAPWTPGARENPYVFCYGTPAHTGNIEDWEDIIAAHFNAPIKSQIFPDIGGFIFDLKHKISSSSISHGKATPLLKQKISNMLWNEHKEQPKADITLRAHTHSCIAAYDPPWWGIILPGLQAASTKFGGRIMSLPVHWGLIEINIYPEEGEIRWKPHIVRIKANKVQPVQVKI